MESIVLKKTCVDAANFLAVHAPHSVEPELARVCAEVLLDMSERLGFYENAVQIGKPFLREFQAAMASLAQIKNGTQHALHEWAFSLFEALVIVIREERLREPKTKEARPAQAEAIRYFTQSGHWRPDDPTLVAEYYYRKIPMQLEESSPRK